MNYDNYNREERYLCAHLFRLLHEWISSDSSAQQLESLLSLSGLDTPPTERHTIGIFFEVALIRDAYFARKPNASGFMDQLVSVVARQEEVSNFTAFSQLPEVLQDSSRTHPKQIRQKADDQSIELSREDSRVYGAVQGMFNAKPDLAITLPSAIIAYEAKFTQAFDDEQTTRTKKIAEVWSEVLFEDLGFGNPPAALVATIGPSRASPDISWEWIFERTSETYPSDDRTFIAIQNAVQLLSETVYGSKT